jgi:hypothetical protein
MSLRANWVYIITQFTASKKKKKKGKRGRERENFFPNQSNRLFILLAFSENQL